MTEDRHCLHLYIGEGKGKTTAAMGLALRAIGHRWPVVIAQFLKTGRSGELLALGTFPQVRAVDVMPVSKFSFKMNDEEKHELHKSQTAQLNRLSRRIDEVEPKLLVLDELAMAMHLKLIDGECAMALIDFALGFGEVVVTGRHAPEALIERADYVSRIEPLRHPYKTHGLRARQGIEF